MYAARSPPKMTISEPTTAPMRFLPLPVVQPRQQRQQARAGDHEQLVRVMGEEHAWAVACATLLSAAHPAAGSWLLAHPAHHLFDQVGFGHACDSHVPPGSPRAGPIRRLLFLRRIFRTGVILRLRRFIVVAGRGRRR